VSAGSGRERVGADDRLFDGVTGDIVGAAAERDMARVDGSLIPSRSDG
jgi:hypothetical protein